MLKPGAQCQSLFARSDRHTYICPHIEAGHRRVNRSGPIFTGDKSNETHMSNNFSTSPGVTSSCTKICGGPVLSIYDLHKQRFSTGPWHEILLAGTGLSYYKERHHRQSCYPIVTPRRKNTDTRHHRLRRHHLPCPSLASRLTSHLRCLSMS